MNVPIIVQIEVLSNRYINPCNDKAKLLRNIECR